MTPRTDEPLTPWDELSDEVRRALVAAWRDGMPAEASALYGRWWQLERWLRSLAYVELRARSGARWADSLVQSAAQRESSDRRHAYMATPDAQARLAYLDFGPLLDLLKQHWPLVGYALVEDEAVWSGRAVELRKIRNRIAHCRRPHADDLSRVEQTLRDLDQGAFKAVAAFNRQRQPVHGLDDPVVAGWIRNEHPDARRLRQHAESQYDVSFILRYSRRPWADRRSEDEPVTGRAGYFWHAVWYVRSGQLDLRGLWEDSYLDRHRDLLVYVCANGPSAVDVSYPAVDDPSAIADAIGNVFDALLMNSGMYARNHGWDEGWATRLADLDARVQTDSPWSVVDDTTVPITMFRA
jgi:hypothetical protein